MFECISRGGSMYDGKSCFVGYPNNPTNTLWGEALSFCQARNGILPVLASDDSSEAAYFASNEHRSFYIGLRRNATEINATTSDEDFYWIDGTPRDEGVTYWSNTQPDNNNGASIGLNNLTETVVYMDDDFEWFDISVS